MKDIFLIFITLNYAFSSLASSSDTVAYPEMDKPLYPEVNKIMPNFILRNIEYYSKDQASLEDFRGKWLILDVWGRHCSSCIESFPLINEELKMFKDQVQFMMVGIEDREDMIRTIYKKYRMRENLEMPCAFDSLFAQRFNISGVPYIIVIDPNGYVRGVTLHLTREKIEEFIQGKTPDFVKAIRNDQKRYEKAYDPSSLFLIKGNGGLNDSDFVYRSLFSKYDTKVARFLPKKIGYFQNKFEALGANLRHLYLYAYSGKHYWEFGDSLYGNFWSTPLLFVKDSSLFLTDEPLKWYCYSISIPSIKGESDERFMKIMQNDLHNYFQYKATLETRKMPYWRLIIADRRKAKSKISSNFNAPPVNNDGSNFPIKNLLSNLCYHYTKEPPFVDETKIKGTINITLKDGWFVFEDVRKALQDSGLDLVKSKRKMRVLIIRDK